MSHRDCGHLVTIHHNSLIIFAWYSSQLHIAKGSRKPNSEQFFRHQTHQHPLPERLMQMASLNFCLNPCEFFHHSSSLTTFPEHFHDVIILPPPSFRTRNLHNSSGVVRELSLYRQLIRQIAASPVVRSGDDGGCDEGHWLVDLWKRVYV